MRDELAFANSQLSRLDFTDEAAKEPGDTQNPPPVPNSHFGVASLPIHYTLGRGVPEALGDKVELAVFHSFREVATAVNRKGIGDQEIDILGTGMMATSFWDKQNRLVCLHLELLHTEQCIRTDDWEEAEREVNQDRSLN